MDRVSARIAKAPAPAEFDRDALFAQLGSKDSTARKDAAVRLQHYITRTVQRLETTELRDFFQDLFKQLSIKSSSKLRSDNLGCIAAIEEMLAVEHPDFRTGVNYHMLGRYLLQMFRPNGDVSVIMAASDCVGHLARQQIGAMTTKFVSMFADKALEWLEHTTQRSEARRLGAAIILDQLGQAQPTSFHPYIPRVFTYIFIAIHDVQSQIRKAGAACLRTCLKIWHGRELYPGIYRSIERGFAERKEETIHGSLLAAEAFIELVGADYLQYTLYFETVCDATLEFYNHKNQQVQRQVLTLISVLGTTRPDTFLNYYPRNGSIAYAATAFKIVLSAFRRERDRAKAFLAMGRLALSLQKSLEQLDVLPRVFHEARLVLTKKGKVTHPKLVSAVCECLGNIARAMGPSIKPQLFETDIKDAKSLIELLYETGLSQPLVKALHSFTVSMPDMANKISRKLLDMISLILQGDHYRHPAASKPAQPGQDDLNGEPMRMTPESPVKPPSRSSRLSIRTSIKRSHSSDRASKRASRTSDQLQAPTTQHAKEEHEQVILALRTLRDFDFGAMTLVKFARDTVTRFLFHENDVVRLEAGLTCAHLVLPPRVRAFRHRVNPRIVIDVLIKLLSVAISDRKSSIRGQVLAAFSYDHDHFLSHVDVLRLLFVSLYDRDFPTRLHALTLVGRLTERNPAYVVPCLRRLLVNLLAGLDLKDTRQKEEESSKLLGHLIKCAPRVVEPYIEAIMLQLVPKLSSPNENVQVNCLGAIGELGIYAGAQVEHHRENVMPFVLEFMKDQLSVAKRAVALRVLGQLARGTAYVVTPYEDYPSLMMTLFICLTEGQTEEIRREASRTMGILGALDPYREKAAGIAAQAEAGHTGQPLPQEKSQFHRSAANAPDEPHYAVGSEEYFNDLALRELISIAYAPAMVNMHDYLVRSIGIIVVKSGTKLVSYLPMIVPAFVFMVAQNPASRRPTLFKEVARIVDIFGPHCRPFLHDLVDCMVRHWLPDVDAMNVQRTGSGALHTSVMALLRACVRSFGREFKSYLPPLLSKCAETLSADHTDSRTFTKQVLDALSLLGRLVEDETYSVVTALVAVFAEYVGTPLSVREQAIQVLDLLVRQIPLKDQTASVVQSLSRIIAFEPELRQAAINALYPLVHDLGTNFERRGHRRTMLRIFEEAGLADDPDVAELTALGPHEAKSHLPPEPKLPPVFDELPTDQAQVSVNRATQTGVLKLVHEASTSTNIDWPDWIRRFSINLLMESRSPSLAACQHLAQHFEPFARRVFNAAFVSCWVALTPSQQRELADGLERAMREDQVFMQMMLNVAEFMTHHTEPVSLPISDKTLGGMALSCHAYAKALRYKEEEFQSFFPMARINNGQRPPPVRATTELLTVVEDLIEVSQALQQEEAARGALVFVRQHTDLKHDSIIQPSWYEKLGEWDKALEAYERQLQNKHSFELERRYMTCLDKLGKWQDLQAMVAERWESASSENRADIAMLACSSAAGLGQWDTVAGFMDYLPSQNPSYYFYAAALGVYQEEFSSARQLIDDCRSALEPLISTLWAESYSRGYEHFVTLQLLSEMEEVIMYKELEGDEVSQLRIRDMWHKRLSGCQYNPEVWQRVLQVRSLVLSPLEDAHMWLKYASLCRKTNDTAGGFSNLGLDKSHNTLIKLLGRDPSSEPERILPHENPQVTYAYIKHMWVAGQRDRALQQLFQLIDFLGAGQHGGRSAPEDMKLLSRCYHKLGMWQASPQSPSGGGASDELSDEQISSIIEAYRYATLFDRTWHKAWHSWALMNFEAVKHFESAGDGEACLSHAVMSLKGFFNAIALSGEKNLQDTLRLLTLLYTYGYHDEVTQTVAAGLHTVTVDTWLEVMPQLIARIHINEAKVRGLLHEMLMQVGRKHPQALLFPLTVAAHNHREASGPRREAAESLLNKMRQHSHVLVDQAIMVSEELIRVAILWHEMWHEAIEEASKMYSERNVDGLLSVLGPLHEKMENLDLTATEREKEFVSQYGPQLHEAFDWLQKFQRTKNRSDLDAAWDHYYSIYRTIHKSWTHMSMLELREVSPKLLEARDLKLVVPGTYGRSNTPVHIKQFVPQLLVINTKQRPRRITIKGDDGRDYQYLLKAREDLRQDERVMQLFGLVNVLLKSHASTAHRHLGIQGYFVLPLSPRLGLIEWVPTCDTLHSLIREHRERNNIVLNIEVKHLLHMCPDYDALPLMPKIEVFQYALSKTPGDDLAQIMWQRSGDSETWLERRSNYTKSLAVMSMVGYILGLGDRHPSNLMLDRKSGTVMHVDFGDCFEVAMHRDKFPERVPFRLTRMMVAAMEVSGVHGTFRITCENVMNVLRDNADSVLAVLEAFVHDPLIDWFGKTKSRATRRTSSTAFGRQGQLSGQLGGLQSEVLNPRALEVIARVDDKLNGNDLVEEKTLHVQEQVRRLMRNAMAHENLCQHYTGWCPFW